MPALTLLQYLGQTILLSFLGIIFCRYLVRHNFKIVRLTGRLNRIEFLCWSIILFIIFKSITALYATLINQVVSDPGYWGLKLLEWALTIVIMPFYFSLYARRFQDFSIPGIFGLIITIILSFLLHFTVVKIWSFFFDIIFLLINFFLILIPGTKGRNPYGYPSTWPSKTSFKELNKSQNNIKKN